MYLIVVGAGAIGTPLIDIATRNGNEVVVIERSETRADKIAATYDCLVINADATVVETLEDAEASRADALISTTEQDATNVMVCLLAQELAVQNVVSVVHNPEHRALFERIGVGTMESPQELIAQHLYRAVARPPIGDFLRIGSNAEVFEITVLEDAPIVGHTLNEANETGLLTDDVLVVAVNRGDEPTITPRGSTLIEAGDLLTVYSAFGASPELTDVFGHYDDDSR